jgi:2-polyprenyl-3-methyl-5-hydroxy-6-metoxy-1,4-benzoquinol methylase
MRLPMHTTFFCADRKFDSGVVEMMDRPQAVSSDLRADLENLRRLNQFFGSYSLVRHFLQKWCKPREQLVLIDLCTGLGDIPRFIVDWSRSHRINIRILAVDFQSSTLQIAREHSRDYPEIEFILANVFEFQETADLVFCSLALHHFTQADAERVVRKVRSMARRGALVADLERTDLGILGIDLLTATVFREPMTRFDARLSIRRAFSFEELGRVAAAAGWKAFVHQRFPVCRQAIAWSVSALS